MFSDKFMNALADQAAAPKKPKIVRKKLSPVSPQQSGSNAVNVVIVFFVFKFFNVFYRKVEDYIAIH